MKKHIFTLAILAAVGLSLSAGRLATAQEARPQPGQGRRGAAPIPEGVEQVPDLEFAKVGERSLKLDLYLPKAEGNQKRPVVVWIYGGMWIMGSRKGGSAIGLAADGFAVANIEYRFSQDALFPAQIEDCKAAIRWLRANADKYRLDTDRIGVWGVSAGGHLAALVGTSGGVKEFDVGENKEFSSSVQAVCDWFGPTDFTQLKPHAPAGSNINYGEADSPEGRLVGGKLTEHMDKTIKANPVTFADSSDPPFLIMHGDEDNLVPLHQSELLAEALKSKGVETTFKILPKSGHGTGAFNSPATRQEVSAFFKKHLRVSSVGK